MSDRTFRLILDGKKGGLVKGSTPSSAAKKACKKLSAEQMKNSSVFHQLSLKDKVLKTEPGKISFKFELQETTKDSKKKVYGPYKGSFLKDKIQVKMMGGIDSNSGSNNNNGSNGNSGSNNNIKNIINDHRKLLDFLFSTNNNNRRYFNIDKFNRFIDFLSKNYSLKDQLNKLISLQRSLNLLHNDFQNGVNTLNKKELDIMSKMLYTKKSEIIKKNQDNRTVAKNAERTSESAVSNFDAKVSEAVQKQNLLERFLKNNENLKKVK